MGYRPGDTRMLDQLKANQKGCAVSFSDHTRSAKRKSRSGCLPQVGFLTTTKQGNNHAILGYFEFLIKSVYINKLE